MIWAQKKRYCSTLRCCQCDRPIIVRSVYAPFFSVGQAWCCLSTAVSTCAAFHDAARAAAGIFSADVRSDTVRYNAVATVSGDAALYTASASGYAVLPTLLLGDNQPFYTAAGIHNTFS